MTAASTAVTGATPGFACGCVENPAQFTLLVGGNAPVGGMVGQERTVLPPTGRRRPRPRDLTAAHDVLKGGRRARTSESAQVTEMELQ